MPTRAKGSIGHHQGQVEIKEKNVFTRSMALWLRQN